MGKEGEKWEVGGIAPWLLGGIDAPGRQDRYNRCEQSDAATN